MNPIEEYLHERDVRLKGYAKDKKLGLETFRILDTLVRVDYVKNFTWLGLPIMQQPSDMFVMQELIHKIQPDFLIETGVAFGGSLLFYATVMEGLEWGNVIGIDIDIREHTRNALSDHPLGHRFQMVKGDSAGKETIATIKSLVGKDKVMVVLDSNHSHNHVLKELQLYSPFVSVGSYIVVFDTTIETMIPKKSEQFEQVQGYADSAYLEAVSAIDAVSGALAGQVIDTTAPPIDVIEPEGKDWGPGDNPMTAVKEFMKYNRRFVVDKVMESQALITSATGGFLRRVK